jgi:hypothetical protein
MSYDDLSVQMGTSVKMLEDHYNHFEVSDNPNKFAGHEKREERQRQVEQDESAMRIRKMVEQNDEQQKKIFELMERLLEKSTK